MRTQSVIKFRLNFAPDTNLHFSASSDEEFENIVDTAIIHVVSALMADCPYDLYWFDKVSGYYWGYSWYSDYSFYELSILFCVSMNYESNYADFEVDPTKGATAMRAANNAKSVVTSNASKGDYEKLVAESKEISEKIIADANAQAKKILDDAEKKSGQMMLQYNYIKEEIRRFKDSVLESYKEHVDLLTKMPATNKNIDTVEIITED